MRSRPRSILRPGRPTRASIRPTRASHGRDRSRRTEKTVSSKQIRQIGSTPCPRSTSIETTTATPEQFVAGLTDFGPGRSKLFPNSADEYLKVHDQGPGHADVTEGSGGVWERLQYDWSDPNRVVMKTTDSNIWGGSSGHTYTFTRQPNGTTAVDAVVVREGKNFKGRVLGRARNHRQGQIGRGSTTNRQGYRGPERGGEGDGLQLVARSNSIPERRSYFTYAGRCQTLADGTADLLPRIEGEERLPGREWDD